MTDSDAEHMDMDRRHLINGGALQADASDFQGLDSTLSLKTDEIKPDLEPQTNGAVAHQNEFDVDTKEVTTVSQHRIN